ncbi:MAG: hypothetical protein EAZ97_14360 [Bacteroidetes bacterium]|nr:MAG: hypothetical protein EAZ97_14360 [Bacteroidota bacterium]
MISNLRTSFNAQFSEEKYENMLANMAKTFDFKIDFKVCETPIFIPKTLQNELVKAGNIIVEQLQNENFRSQIHKAVPKNCVVPNQEEDTTFMVVDFAICKDSKGELLPQLIELQGFPSLFGFQYFLNENYRKHYQIPENVSHYFNNHTNKSYWQTLKDAIVGNEDPEQVVLMEIEPEKQKTKIDFYCTQKYLGVNFVCLSKIKKRGNKLFYENKGREVQIKKIYNRIIFDELALKKDFKYEFDPTQEADVKWAGHPNWFFKISKFSLPFLDNPYVPKTVFVSDLKQIPEDLENYVLKPLYSFAGSGVKFDVKKEMIEQIPEHEKEHYILMKKVQYEPLIQTLDQPAKVEVRLMMVRKNGKMELLTNLIRLSKGKMMGVDFNKGMNWVGGSIGYFEK